MINELKTSTLLFLVSDGVTLIVWNDLPSDFVYQRGRHVLGSVLFSSEQGQMSQRKSDRVFVWNDR